MKNALKNFFYVFSLRICELYERKISSYKRGDEKFEKHRNRPWKRDGMKINRSPFAAVKMP